MAVTKDAIDAALEHGHTIDITTTGRRTGRPRRIEIVFHNIDGQIYISGMPRRDKRDWLLNLEADPRFTFHLKGRARRTSPRLRALSTMWTSAAPSYRTWRARGSETTLM